MIKTIDIDEVHPQLAQLLALTATGDEVIISVNEKPVAKLVAVTASRKTRIAGLNKGDIWMSEDFDAPLPDEFWTGGQ